jgi:hypothetical protein
MTDAFVYDTIDQYYTRVWNQFRQDFLQYTMLGWTWFHSVESCRTSMNQVVSLNRTIDSMIYTRMKVFIEFRCVEIDQQHKQVEMINNNIFIDVLVERTRVEIYRQISSHDESLVDLLFTIDGYKSLWIDMDFLSLNSMQDWFFSRSNLIQSNESCRLYLLTVDNNMHEKQLCQHDVHFILSALLCNVTDQLSIFHEKLNYKRQTSIVTSFF